MTQARNRKTQTSMERKKTFDPDGNLKPSVNIPATVREDNC
jgi:hypothetical protein